MIGQLICFTLGLILFGFGFFVGVYPQGDQTVGVLIMFGGLAQILYSFGVINEWIKILSRSWLSYLLY